MEGVELKMERGYARIERKWAKGDKSSYICPARAPRESQCQVQEDRDMVAWQRGPLCIARSGRTITDTL
jgi:DUF1680 family protein